MTHGRVRLVAMAVLATAFLIRVVGQAALVAGWAPGLPPLEQWQSGLLPYPALLVSQVAILGFLGVALRHAYRGGPLASPGRFAGPVRAFAVVYAGSMVARYVLTRLAHPEWGLLGHTIPIWLHLALAAWLWLWAAKAGRTATGRAERGQRRRGRSAGEPSRVRSPSSVRRRWPRGHLAATDPAPGRRPVTNTRGRSGRVNADGSSP